MTYRDVMLSIRGLRQRDKMHESWLRRVTFIIGATNFGGKTVSQKFNQLWPDGEGKTLNVSQSALDTLRRFRENAAMKKVKEKLNGGT